MKILLIAGDAALEAELAACFAGSWSAAAIHSMREPRKGIESARDLEPALAILPLTTDLVRLGDLRRELAAVSPRTAVAAAYDPQTLDAAAIGPLLIEVFRTGFCDVLRRPLSSADVRQLVARLASAASPPALRLGHVACFISNKGGVGKSTLAINTACGLALKYPGEVLLIDAALQMGVCGSMLDLKPTTTIMDALRERDRLDATLLRQLTTPHSSGLDLLAAPASVVDAAEIDDEAMTRVLNVARRAYRYVIVDTFPLLDRVVVAILDLSDRLYLVVENVVPTLIGARSMIGLLGELGVATDRLRLVLNRYSTRGGSLKPHEVAMELGVPVAHVIPWHTAAIVAANTGVPYMLRRSWFGPSSATARLVDDLASVSSARNGRAPRGAIADSTLRGEA